jgi:CTP synthase (UTP-ammonia lyase)
MSGGGECPRREEIVVPIVGVVGDYNPENLTHLATESGLAHAAIRFEWVSTTDVRADGPEERLGRYAGLFIATASPYRHMDGLLAAIRLARERGVPLVGS